MNNFFLGDNETLQELLNPVSPQKLMYVFYIVDWLGRPTRLRRPSGLSENGFFAANDPDLGTVYFAFYPKYFHRLIKGQQ